MAVAFVDGAVHIGNPSTVATITISAGALAGRGMYLTHYNRGSSAFPTVTDNGGGSAWTMFYGSTNGSTSFSIWYKEAVAGSVGSTITALGSVGAGACVMGVYSGQKKLQPYSDIKGETNASANVTQASILPGRADSMVCISHGNPGAAVAVASPACTNPGALQKRHEALSTAGAQGLATHSSELQVGGPTDTGAFTWTQTNALGFSVAWSIPPEPPAGTFVRPVSLRHLASHQ